MFGCGYRSNGGLFKSSPPRKKKSHDLTGRSGSRALLPSTTPQRNCFFSSILASLRFQSAPKERGQTRCSAYPVSLDPGDSLHASSRSASTSSSFPFLHSADAPVLRSGAQANLVLFFTSKVPSNFRKMLTQHTTH